MQPAFTILVHLRSYQVSHELQHIISTHCYLYHIYTSPQRGHTVSLALSSDSSSCWSDRVSVSSSTASLSFLLDFNGCCLFTVRFAFKSLVFFFIFSSLSFFFFSHFLSFSFLFFSSLSIRLRVINASTSAFSASFFLISSSTSSSVIHTALLLIACFFLLLVFGLWGSGRTSNSSNTSEEVTLDEAILGGVTDGFETAVSDSDGTELLPVERFTLGILTKLMMDSWYSAKPHSQGQCQGHSPPHTAFHTMLLALEWRQH